MLLKETMYASEFPALQKEFSEFLPKLHCFSEASRKDSDRDRAKQTETQVKDRLINVSSGHQCGSSTNSSSFNMAYFLFQHGILLDPGSHARLFY